MIEKVINSISEDIYRLSELVLSDSRVSTNVKTGKDTLDSNLLKDHLQVAVSRTKEGIVITTFVDNYINYIEAGRKPRSGKQPPIDKLRDWAMARNIPSDNSTLYLISRAIWRDGIAPRPILSTLEEYIDQEFRNNWSDQLFEAITNDINKYFR